MTVPGRRFGAVVLLVMLVGVATWACSPTQPSAPVDGSGAPAQPSATLATDEPASAGVPSSPPASDDAGPGPGSDDFALGCISIAAAECQAVADLVVEQLPVGRGVPFAILIHLYGCGNPCAQTLDAREGKVTVEYADGGEPIEATVFGPADAPIFGETETAWSGLIEPASVRVDGPGPFPHELGHCGLLWQVDFDGSFWLPVGEVDGDAADLFNAGTGEMVLLGPNVAQYADGSGFTVDLARFPGPKHVFLCR